MDYIASKLKDFLQK